jgi:predicted peroxiredoxin
METKYAIIVMSENGEEHPGGQGRMVHALKTAKEFKAAGVPVKMFFHGIGVQWLTMFDTKPDKFTQNYGPLFDEVRDTIGGACHFCAATRFGAGEAAERLGVPLLGKPGDHHTIASVVADGYQPIVF